MRKDEIALCIAPDVDDDYEFTIKDKTVIATKFSEAIHDFIINNWNECIFDELKPNRTLSIILKSTGMKEMPKKRTTTKKKKDDDNSTWEWHGSGQAPAGFYGDFEG